MSHERDLSTTVKAASDSAALALEDFEAAIQKGRELFVLEGGRVAGDWSFLLAAIGFTSINPSRRRVRLFSPGYSDKLARLSRLQAWHGKAAQSQKYIGTNCWRIVLIYLGPFIFSIGPNLVTLGSVVLHGAAKEALVAFGSVVSALPIFSTLLKKSKVLDLRKELENEMEDAIKNHKIQTADELGFMAAWNWVGYLAADVANVAIGSWAAFRKNVGYGIGNAVPDIVGLCIILPLCIYQAEKIGAKEFPHDIDGTSGRFNEFVSEDEKTRRKRRLEVWDNVNRKSKVPNIAILIYASASLIIHVVLILHNQRGRGDNAYVYDVAIPSIINFIAATYLMARLMQQVFPNYFLAHARAE